MTNYFAGDLRRAGLAVQYHGQQNAEGLHAIIEEAAEEHRVTELLQCITTVNSAIIEVLLTPVAMYSISTEIANWSHTSDDPDLRRAATWICAHAHNNVDIQNQVLHEAAQPENRLRELIVMVLGVHALFLRAAHTDFGRERMKAVVDRMILRENGIDPDEGAA